MARRGRKQPDNKDINNPADFTGGQVPSAENPQPAVFIAPGVDPAAAAYAAGAQARRARKAALPKANMPVGGAPMPHVPNLGSDHVAGQTMSQTAEQQNYERLMAAQGSQNTGVPGADNRAPSVVEMPPPQALQPQGQPANLGIRPGDVLPDSAREDPQFRRGQGDMVAAAQPNMALKYGVMRQGQWVAPQKLQNPNGQPQRHLSQQSVDDLAKIQELQRQQTTTEGSGLPTTEAEAMKGLPDAAHAAAQAAGKGASMTEEEKEQIKEEVDKLDEFQLATVRERMMKDIIQNDKQRDLIEARLDDLKIDDLLLHNRVTQEVPIIPGKFTPTFQSVNAQEDLAIKRLIMQESEGVQVSEQYLIDKYSMFAITLGLKAVNGKELGTHEDNQGHFNDEKFFEKFNRIARLPTHMIASIGVNYGWFEERVRKLFVAEEVGNG